ncbi:putative ribosomally synthesized peptide with SipW-like signal peptide [Kineococcus xinjiangensis]|uniref:Putative ribosomally synthesized peptide with SipW-like signal peptide n=1 Tax=Kineococcus xinjiangensis TaxID=512762 RepID=A0A2S6IDW0_9ACTN|nr:hypothetical protein [Kineococcus xinjiangensis]PPK92404.1 putative ribosomally synthesized peptide with SipW-like signal peptide [Kineococcus xinjiangensis]
MSARSERRRRGAAIAAVPLGLLMSGVLVYQSSSAAFTARTETDNNTFTAGSMTLTNNDTGAATIVVTNIIPSTTWVDRCIRVAYVGQTATDLALYTTTTHTADTAAAGTYLSVDDATLDGSTNLWDLDDQLQFRVSARLGSHTTDATSTTCAEAANGTAWTAATEPQFTVNNSNVAQPYLKDPVSTTTFPASHTSYTNGIRMAGLAAGSVSTPTYITYRISYLLPHRDTAYTLGTRTGTENDGAQGDQVTLRLAWEARQA